MEVIEISSGIKQKTIEVRKNSNIKLPDAIIAATAIQNDLTLLTRNIKDFTKVKELKVYNPFETR
jgi:predicted nucleic acid-binding protein